MSSLIAYLPTSSELSFNQPSATNKVIAERNNLSISRIAQLDGKLYRLFYLSRRIRDDDLWSYIGDNIAGRDLKQLLPTNKGFQ